jgi:hypothetical protein
MPLMSPHLPNDEIEILPANKNAVEINPNALEVLKAAGVNSKRGSSRMSPLLSDEGLGLEEIARKLSNFASYSEDETIQFNATKLALQLHGELDKDGADKNAGVQINFVGVTPELLSVLIPRS